MTRNENLTEDEAVDQVPLFRKKRVVIPVLLFAVASAFVAYVWYVKYREYVSTDDAMIDADRVSVSTKILGRITQLTADEGDTVHTGDILVRLDDTDLRAQEAQARASLRLAEENLSLVTVNVDRAMNDYRRADVQFRQSVITREQYDHARNALDAANAEAGIARSKIAAARTQLDVVLSQLRNTLVAAPIDGIVAKRWLLTGDVAQPGQAILTVFDSRRLWITANFEETKMSEIRAGAPVSVSVDAYPEREFHGSISQIGTYTASEFSLIPANNASGNFTKVTQRIPVRISIDDSSPGDPLFPGMSVEVSVKATR